MADDLSTPLGRHRTRKSSRLRSLLPVGIAGLLGVCLTVFGVWAAVVDDPHGGEPVVVVQTASRTPAKKPSDPKPDTAHTESPAEVRTADAKSAPATPDVRPAETPVLSSKSGP